MSLVKVRPLSDQAGMAEAIGGHVARNAKRVCAVCGLQVMGHGPESRWLGHDAHDWQPIPATLEQIQRADRLTTEAYRLRYHSA